MSLEMAHKVIVPQKKNYVPQFLKQRDIYSYKGSTEMVQYKGADEIRTHELLFIRQALSPTGPRRQPIR